LFKEGDESRNVYIIKEGTFDVLKNFSINKDTGVITVTKIPDKAVKRNRRFFSKYPCLTQERFETMKKSDIRNTLKAPKIQNKVVKLTSISDGHVLGLSDYLFRSSKKFISVICTSKTAKVAKMHIQDIATNLNTIEISKHMRTMVLNNLSVLGESLNNALKLENVALLNTSTSCPAEREDIQEISKALKGEEEKTFYKRLRSLKIVNPIKEIVQRNNPLKVDVAPTSFYKQLCIEDKHDVVRKIWSPEPKIRKSLFVQKLDTSMEEKK